MKKSINKLLLLMGLLASIPFQGAYGTGTSDQPSGNENEQTPLRVDDDTVIILSLDGGGIRGVIGLTILHEIEKKVEGIMNRTGDQGLKFHFKRPNDDGLYDGYDPKSVIFTDAFDVIAGTSTGSIQAAALAIRGNVGGLSEDPPYSVKKVMNIYKQNAGDIFSLSRLWSVYNYLTSKGPTAISGPKYGHENLERLLKQYFGESRPLSGINGDIMSELDRKLVLITAVDLRGSHGCVFANEQKYSFFACPRHKYRFYRNRDLPIWQVVRASTAAPTYFGAVRIDPQTEEEREAEKEKKNPDHNLLIDGGLFCNNPSFRAYRSGVKYYDTRIKQGKISSVKKYVVISMGTGHYDVNFNNASHSGWGPYSTKVLPEWSTTFNTKAGHQDLEYEVELNKLFKEANEKHPELKYYRFDIDLKDNKSLDPKCRQMDNKAAVEPLIVETNRLIKKEWSEKIDEIAGLIASKLRAVGARRLTEKLNRGGYGEVLKNLKLEKDSGLEYIKTLEAGKEGAINLSDFGLFSKQAFSNFLSKLQPEDGGSLSSTPCFNALSSLNLSRTGLGSERILRLCEALSSVSTLRHLDLSGNRVDFVIIDSLAELLCASKSPSRKEIVLQNCGIKENAVLSLFLLINEFRESFSYEHELLLDVRNNPISESDIKGFEFVPGSGANTSLSLSTLVPGDSHWSNSEAKLPTMP